MSSSGILPVVILIEPQMPENIGATARAMLNFGLTELRLVRPEKKWPHQRAYDLASGADIVLDQAQLMPTTEVAVADLHRLYATTARNRDMLKPVLTPRAAAQDMREAVSQGQRVGILFGGERAGLVNEDIVLAEKLIAIPTNPDFASLNLAQAVLLIAHEWFQAGAVAPPMHFDMGRTRMATREELNGLFEHLERELNDSGYFDLIESKRPAMIANIRNSLQRGPLLEQDISTLRGIIKHLAGKRIPGSKRGKKQA